MSLPPPLPRPRSTFVTVLAWISLSLAILGVVSGLLQAVLLAVSGLGDQLAAMMTQGLQAPLPPLLERLLRHLALINFASMLASLAFGVASWGLVQRREWGRQGFIALLLLSAAVGLVWTWLFTGVVDWVFAQGGAAPALDASLASFKVTMKASLYVGALTIAALHAGIAWKLNTRAIRAEFA